MEFRLLGPMEVRSGGRLVPIRGIRLRALLTTLLLYPNRTVLTEHLAHAVWPDPPRAAAANLRTYVAQLRTVLRAAGQPATRLVTDPLGYRLEVASDELDVAAFDLLVAEAERAATDEVVLTRLRTALGMWRGAALAGVSGGDQLAFEAAMLEERRLHAATTFVDAALATGRTDEASAVLAGLVRTYPLHEGLWRRLMLAQYRSGRPAAAFTAYQEATCALDEQSGIRPGRPLRRLHRQIVDGEPPLDFARRGQER